MKRLIPLSAALLLIVIAAPAFAIDTDTRDKRGAVRGDRARTHIVDDVIRMTQAGVETSLIISFIRQSRDRFDVTAGDVIAMKDAGVANDVIKEVIAEAEARHDRREPGYAPRVYGGVFVDPWYWGGPLWDPWWYGPRLSVGVRLGSFYGGHRGHYYRDHRYRGRGRR